MAGATAPDAGGLPEETAAVQRRLGLGDEQRPWLEELAALGASGGAAVPVASGWATEVMRHLGVAAEDGAGVVAAPPPVEREAAWRWLFARNCWRLARGIGRWDGPGGEWPVLPPALGAVGRFFFAHVFLATLPDIRRWHAANGVPDGVSWEALGTLGRSLALHRRRLGCGGVLQPRWVAQAFRGRMYELGRLQYTPHRIGAGGPRRGIAAQALGLQPGDPAVGIHIPASGPLLPAACAQSLARARAFFGRSAPLGPCRIATCSSWLLDEQLAEYLPASSNIVAFQRRFHLLPGAGDGDAAVFRHVFLLPGPVEPDALPQRTTLERAIVRHLRAGRHWQTRVGWLEL